MAILNILVVELINLLS